MSNRKWETKQELPDKVIRGVITESVNENTGVTYNLKVHDVYSDGSEDLKSNGDWFRSLSTAKRIFKDDYSACDYPYRWKLVVRSDK